VENVKKMKTFYGERGIDICKDAVSLPGMALQYLLKGTVENKLFAPSKEAYNYLKAAVSGGPSIVFTRYHEVRNHKNSFTLLCRS